jgi:hypothetical protein
MSGGETPMTDKKVQILRKTTFLAGLLSGVPLFTSFALFADEA